MTIVKMELVEGGELLYKNPYPKGIEVSLGPNLAELKKKPRDMGFILQWDESVSFCIKPGIPVYILTLERL